ncbi:hypothetical protein LF95_08535 [Thalassospira sp. TSL5-1]|nr:hypothetical protein LF95_08535 [Thalassospira sp. TSL5-1]
MRKSGKEVPAEAIGEYVAKDTYNQSRYVRAMIAVFCTILQISAAKIYVLKKSRGLSFCIQIRRYGDDTEIH